MLDSGPRWPYLLSLSFLSLSRLLMGPRGPDSYTTVFIPLSSSLFSNKAVSFYLWLKQMKELEQQKDSLLSALEVLDQSRDWFQGQIQNVTEAQRILGQRPGAGEPFSESTPSRLDVLLPRLQELTRTLSELIAHSKTTLPSSSALSDPGSSSAAPAQALHTLKEHNRLLTQEVSEKSDRIVQLEQEKSALIKQLFDARASANLDSTFI
ncbi:hypothetical protein DNTS_034514 [Danionella cerebrum]|uniref:Suppressor APC domain-containing protein 2 n=1 Tax=Danionella cerebrum TaxID=2873325 RepID=A0A553MPI0_9TELE|nr:hypothetical protein DNTS_034514 [Danionella translucida]